MKRHYQEFDVERESSDVAFAIIIFGGIVTLLGLAAPWFLYLMEHLIPVYVRYFFWVIGS